MLHSLGRRIGFVPMLFFGLGGVPFGMPRPCPLTVVVGKPIQCPSPSPPGGERAPPSEEIVAKCHAELLEAYRRIFETNKARFGMGHVSLRII
jgi:hypothetical protein